MLEGYERIFEKLDRALCCNERRLSFPEAIVRVLPRVNSHHPLLISLENDVNRIQK